MAQKRGFFPIEEGIILISGRRNCCLVMRLEACHGRRSHIRVKPKGVIDGDRTFTFIGDGYPHRIMYGDLARTHENGCIAWEITQITERLFQIFHLNLLYIISGRRLRTMELRFSFSGTAKQTLSTYLPISISASSHLYILRQNSQALLRYDNRR
jgi:hypothetical protein